MELRRPSRALFASLGACLAVLGFATLALAQTPTLTTDLPDYLPGQTVHITGTGWMPGETVSILLQEDLVTHGERTLSATADANGAFTNSEFAPEEHDVGITFTATATGQTSGWTAQTTFADGGTPIFPFAQPIPYVQDFSTLPHSGGCLNNNPFSCTPGESWPPGWEGWRVFASIPGDFPDTDPFFDENLRWFADASFNAGGVHNYNGKIGILASGTSNPALVLALNTAGWTGLELSFDIMTIRNPYNGVPGPAGGTRINRVDVQFFNWNTLLWESVSEHPLNGNPPQAGIYESLPGPTKTAAGDTSPQHLVSVTLQLPPEADWFPELYIRWVQKDFTGAGARPSFAIDNIRVLPADGCGSVDPAGLISGPTTLCPGAFATYSIDPVAGATTYAWSVPDAATIVSGDGTSMIVFRAGPFGGPIVVTPSNGCQSGGASTVLLAVDSSPPTLNGMPGDLVVFTGPGASTCSAPASWTPPTAVDNCSSAVLSSSHSPGASFPVGETIVTYTALDAMLLSTSASFTVTVVDNTPPTLNGMPADVVAYTGPDATTCTASASWTPPTAGDNCPGAILTGSPGSGGSFPLGETIVTYTATDAAGLSTSASFTVTVIDNTPPTIACPDNIEATGGGSSCAATVTFEASAGDNCEGVAVSASPPSGSPFPIGITTVQVTAMDASGNTTNCSFDVTVSNPAPTAVIASPASGAISAVGTTVLLSGAWTDNVGDTHTARWYFDGVLASDPVSILGDGSGAGGVTTSHVFTLPGVYKVSLEILDQCGNSVTSNEVGGVEAMVVIYDPSAGFVTGGGWIMSPPGAYADDGSLFGKANFGFVSRYKRGATIPTGETEFQFRVADLNFHSISYEWLVIAGAMAQYKGRGTINGGGDYAFMLTAIDGERAGGGPDKFRMKIWDRVGGGLVYDNQLGADNDVAPTLALGGGSIVIHAAGQSTVAPVAMGSPSIEAVVPAAPAVLAVRPSFPNPFVASTRFALELPEEANVEITIFDVRGRLVHRLVDGVLPAGRHEPLWDGRDAQGMTTPPGMYWSHVRVRPESSSAGVERVLKLVRATP